MKKNNSNAALNLKAQRPKVRKRAFYEVTSDLNFEKVCNSMQKVQKAHAHS